MRIRWTEPATRDLTQISDYIEQNDGVTQARAVAPKRPILQGTGNALYLDFNLD